MAGQDDEVACRQALAEGARGDAHRLDELRPGVRAPERTLVAVRATVPVTQNPPNSA